MSDKTEYVEVPFGDNAEEKATLLLAAAEDSKDHSAADVRTVTGAFLVPKALADAAGTEGMEQARANLAVREADIPGGLIDTYKMGPGPTGEVDTNAGPDAETGTIQNEQGEQKMGEPARDRVLNDDSVQDPPANEPKQVGDAVHEEPAPKRSRVATKKSATKDKE